MATLDKIVIEIGGDTKDLNNTIAQLEKLGIVDKKNSEQFKKSHSEHQKAIKETGGEVDRLEGKMRNLAERLVAIFAVERIYEFAAESVKAFEQAELSAKKLEFAITKINGGTQESFKKLTEQSEKLAKSLNYLFTPKQIQDAQTQLANFGLTTSQIEKLIPKVLDLSRASGIDLTSATEKAILAINGQTKGLRDVGISFKDTGSKTQNLSKLMGDLDKFTGAAADSMDTFSGKSQEASNQMEVLQERLGKQLAPIWEGFKKGALEAASSLTELTKSAFGFGDEASLRKQYEDIQGILKMGGDLQLMSQKQRDIFNTVQETDKLNDKQLAERLKSANQFLGTLEKTDEGYSTQLEKVKMLTELSRNRLKVEEKVSKEVIKDDLTLKGDADAEARSKKKIEDEKKLSDAVRKSMVDNANEEFKLEQKNTEEGDKKIAEINADSNKKKIDELDKYYTETEKRDTEDYNRQVQINKDLAEVKEKQQKEALANMFETTKMFLDAIELASEDSVKSLEYQMQMQQNVVDTQRVKAEQGLANDLAFEERRQNEMEKKKQQELKKQRRIKELETFLNSIAKFSEDNPNTALAKALGLLAATKAAEAVFAEDGALLGDSGQKSWRGRRHASGKDILVHAEQGEGLLSRKEIGALGGKQGFFALKDYLKNPLQERAIPLAKMFDNSGVISRLESLEQTIKNKPDYHIEWDGLEYRIETSIKNGIKERMKIQRPIL